MAITKARKEALVTQYKELAEKSSGIILTSFSGVTVKDLQGLRGQIREVGGEFHIVKNSLMDLAFKDLKLPLPEGATDGTTAIGFATEEIPAVAKAIVDLSREAETLQIKGGLIDGELIDSADGTFYLHGHGQVLPGLEKALEGLVAGERTRATISPEGGYGERDESRVIQAPTEGLPAGLAPGATLRAQLPNGGVVPLTVVAIDGPTATLDGNHPLAGKTLVFDVEVREVYAATAQDLAHGHVH